MPASVGPTPTPAATASMESTNSAPETTGSSFGRKVEKVFTGACSILCATIGYNLAITFGEGHSPSAEQTTPSQFTTWYHDVFDPNGGDTTTASPNGPDLGNALQSGGLGGVGATAGAAVGYVVGKVIIGATKAAGRKVKTAVPNLASKLAHLCRKEDNQKSTARDIKAGDETTPLI